MAIEDEVVGDRDAEGEDGGQQVVHAERLIEDGEDDEVDHVPRSTYEPELEELDPIFGLAGSEVDPANKPPGHVCGPTRGAARAPPAARWLAGAQRSTRFPVGPHRGTSALEVAARNSGPA